MKTDNRPHLFATRLFHMLIAILVVLQLALSQLMQTPRKNVPGDIWFELHEYIGISVFVMSLLFFGFLFTRSYGTPVTRLLPWFSRAGMSDLIKDLKLHFKATQSLKLPPHEQHSPLASAVHGLGLLLMISMGLTGFIWYLTYDLLQIAKPFGHFAKETHEVLSNLVWVYLIAHGGFAFLNHFIHRQSLTEMWSVKNPKDV